MKFSLLVLSAILVSALSIVGLAVAPTASALPSLQRETTPIEFPLQPYYLSVTLTTDKAVYLAGETVSITVTTSVINTHVRITAQLLDGSESQIGSFTFNYSHTFSWTAPATSGQIRLNCDAEALTEVWDYCTRLVCVGPDDTDCHLENAPCLRTITVTGNTYNSISVFPRTASVSGRVLDTNQNPVPGAALTLGSTGQTATSGNDGSYQFSLQLGNNYGLINGIPAVTDTITVDAVACEPQPGKNVQIQAGQNASSVNFTLNRVFYPADLDLSYFTYAALPGWTAARDFATWQNIMAFTVDGPVQLAEVRLGNQPVTPTSFDIIGKKLYFITAPELGSYVLDIAGAPNSEYTIGAAATINGNYLQQTGVTSALNSSGNERLKFVLEPGQIQLQVRQPFPIALTIIIIVIFVLGGLAAAFFLTGGIKRWRTAFTFRKPAKTKVVTTISKPANEKAAAKKTAAGRQARNRTKPKEK